MNMLQFFAGPMGGGISFQTYWETRIRSVFGADLVAYFPCNDISGTTITEVVAGYDATSANVTMNQAGPINMKSALWGATSYADIYTAASHLNTAEGSIIMFIKMPLDKWLDSTQYKLLHLRYTGLNDEILINKPQTGQSIKFTLIRNGTTKIISSPQPYNADWFCVTVTWSTTNDRIQLFINNVLYWEFINVTGIGTHTGAALRADLAGLGSGKGGAVENSLIGGISNVIFLNKETTETELQSLFTIDQVIFDGDSRTAYKGWNVCAIGANFISPRNVAVSGYSITDCIAAGATSVDAKLRAGKKNICVIWAGVNDYAQNPATIYSRLQTYCLARRAAGFKVIVCTEIDCQDAAHIASGWPAEYLDLNTLIRNDHSFADVVADLGANVNLQDATNTTYFLADKLHLQPAGYIEVATTIKPVITSLLATM